MSEDNKAMLVTTAEQQLIGRVLLDIINDCSNVPSNLTVQYGNLEDSESIGLIPNGKSIYTKRWITGSYEAQFQAVLVYRVRPTDTIQRLQAQNIVESIGKYLETMEYPSIDGNRKIIKIERLTTSELAYRDESGIEDWQLPLVLNYKYKKG